MIYCTSWSSDSERVFVVFELLRISVNKCLNNLFLVLEQTNRVSFASFSDYNVTCVINCAVGGIVFKGIMIRQSPSVYATHF